MTNEEAARFYVRRAQLAQRGGELGRANHLFHTAALHDSNNMDAKHGIEATANVQPEQQRDNPPPTHRHRRKRPWWKRRLKLG